MIDLLKAIFKNSAALMNLVAAFGILYVGWILRDDLLAEQTQDGVWLFTGLYFVLLSLPAFTALALIQQDRRKLQWVMLGANGSLVVLWLVAGLWIVAMHMPKSWLLVGAVFFVVPGWLNLRALRRSIRTGANPLRRRRK